MDEPGSPSELFDFARWCRLEVDQLVAAGGLPALLFADGPEFDEALCVCWELEGRSPETVELLSKLIPAWVDQTVASQVAVAMPFGGPPAGVTLVALDESDWLAEEARLDLARLRVDRWHTVDFPFPVAEWQRPLAANAGYRDFAKWRCRHCQSVCPGEADTIPSPCDYCDSEDIVRVARTTPLREPDPPWGPTSFLETVRRILEG